MHMDCYRSVKESIGLWYCELCEELRSLGVLAVNFWEKFASATECTLRGGTTGAFRKCTDGKWVHAFCAEVNDFSFVVFVDISLFLSL